MLGTRCNARFAKLVFYLSLSTRLILGATFSTLLSSTLKADGVVWQPLARITIDKLPSAPVFIALTRVTYDARAAQPSGSRPGPVLEHVETGRIELQPTGTLTVLSGPPGTASKPETIDQGTPVTLKPAPNWRLLSRGRLV